MGITIYALLLTAVTATVASAGVYAGASSFGGFNPSMNNPIKLPWISDLPFPSFPQFPNFPQMKPISGQNVISQGARPGTNFNGVFVSSHHTSSRGENGQVERKGGSTMVFNDNGHVIVQKTGNAPPEVTVNQYKNPPFADIQESEFKRNIKDSDFDFPSFEPIVFKPVDTDLSKIVPGGNTQFNSKSWSFNAYSDADNGVKTSGGEASLITNDNGNVKEEKYSF